MKQNNRKIYKRFAVQLLFVMILLFSFSGNTFGQKDETEKPTPVIIPDQAREQVVRRILTWYFKPGNQKKVIYLAQERLQNSWLPHIADVEFQLLSAAEVEKSDGVYSFTELEKVEKKYQIGFAFGDPSCSYSGDSWYFRISKQRVRLWHDGSGFGAGCSRGDRNDNDS